MSECMCVCARARVCGCTRAILYVLNHTFSTHKLTRCAKHFFVLSQTHPSALEERDRNKTPFTDESPHLLTQSTVQLNVVLVNTDKAYNFNLENHSI